MQDATSTAGRRRNPILQGRLTSRPGAIEQKDDEATTLTGLQSLELGGERDGFLYVPSSYRAERPNPLVLMLHGAGDTARGGMSPFFNHAEVLGLLLLAPSSRSQTWDVIRSSYGPDVEFINRALTHVFSSYAIDTTHLAIEGFSDGATYALSLGLANGDLFSHIIAFSPGFIAPALWKDSPRIYISHGTQDPVLPINRCSRRIVPELQRGDYDVSYHEFPGWHYVPAMIVREALGWFLSDSVPS